VLDSGAEGLNLKGVTSCSKRRGTVDKGKERMDDPSLRAFRGSASECRHTNRKSELERLVLCCWIAAGNRFKGDARHAERNDDLSLRNQDDVVGRAGVSRDEEREEVDQR